MKNNLIQTLKPLTIGTRTVVGTLILAWVLSIPKINYGKEIKKTKLIFDLNTDITQLENFYNIPFPY